MKVPAKRGDQKSQNKPLTSEQYCLPRHRKSKMAAEPKLIRSLSEEVTCAICDDHYVNPKIIPCGHRFCRDCLEGHMSASMQELDVSFNCPYCRGVTMVPATGHSPQTWSDAYPTDFVLKSLTEKISKASEDIVACRLHKDHSAIFYCEDCKKPGCCLCIVEEHRQCCKPKLLAECAKKAREDGESRLTRFRTGIKLFESNLRSLAKEEENLSSRRKAAVTNFTNKVQTLVNKLLDLANSGADDIDAKYQAELDRLETKKKDEETNLDTIKLWEQWATYCLEKENDLDLIRANVSEELDKIQVFLPNEASLVSEFVLNEDQYYRRKIEPLVSGTLKSDRMTDYLDFSEPSTSGLKRKLVSNLDDCSSAEKKKM